MELELREDLKKYLDVEDPPTPSEVFPLIRKHPALAITSKLKQGAMKDLNFSFQNSKVQTIVFPVRENEKLIENLNLAKSFIQRLDNPIESTKKKGTVYFKDLTPKDICSFLSRYNFAKSASSVNASYLIDYILEQNKLNELLTWDLILPAGALKNDAFTWGKNITTHKVWRSKAKRSLDDENASIKVLTESEDIKNWRRDLSRRVDDKQVAGLFLYIIDSQSYIDEPEKNLFYKTSKTPQDILGFAIDFPTSKSNATVTYASQGR